MSTAWRIANQLTTGPRDTGTLLRAMPDLDPTLVRRTLRLMRQAGQVRRCDGLGPQTGRGIFARWGLAALPSLDA
jgi:hypothetical protein